jgi:hypothetical protein
VSAVRRARWAAAAVILVMAAAALLLLGEREPEPARPVVEFPRWHDEEVARLRRRATLVLPVASAERAPPSAPPAEANRRDPFLVALPVKPDSPVVVFEANALRNSRLGELLLACLAAREPARLAEVERETGIDPLKDIDRVAFMGDAMVVSGFFDHLRWGALAGPAEPYGQAGRIFQRPGMTLGAWSDAIVVIADRPEDVRMAIDQLEGRRPVPEAGIPEEMSYGEIYGALPATAVRRLLGDGDLSDRIAALASRIELNVNAMQDVAATVRVRGDDPAGLSDLARSLGAALAVARAQAQRASDARLAELLESAAVHLGERGFTLQLAVPADRLASWFQGCERWGPPPGR